MRRYDLLKQEEFIFMGLTFCKRFKRRSTLLYKLATGNFFITENAKMVWFSGLSYRIALYFKSPS